MSHLQAGVQATRGPSREPSRVLGNKAGAFSRQGYLSRRAVCNLWSLSCLWSPKFGRR